MTTRTLSVAALAFALFGSTLAAQSGPNAAATQAVSNGLKHVSQARYDDALSAFQSALALSPNVYGAHSGMAEAYLGLNRVEDAKRIYMHLFVTDRVSANALMSTMKAWIESRRAEPAGMAPAALARFERWVNDRDALAGTVIDLGHNMPDWK